MGILNLTDSDVNQVRFLVGNRVTDDLLSNDDIRSDSVLGMATDYVYEKVREGVDFSALDATQSAVAERLYDDNPDDVDSFVSIVLKPPQPGQFRRAVIVYTAGLCLPVVQQIRQETKGGIQQSIDIADWTEKQANFFERADQEIQRLRAAFPTDAFPTSGRRPLRRYFAITSC